MSVIVESSLFKHAPKLRHLLEYVCNKALLEEREKITEYTIAIDVFGKPPTFKESKDSNVRVEIYRLRKRLAQFYETEGQDRPIRIVILSGRYAPEFHYAEASDTVEAITLASLVAAPELGEEIPDSTDVHIEPNVPSQSPESLAKIPPERIRAPAARPSRFPVILLAAALAVTTATGLLVWRSNSRPRASVPIATETEPQIPAASPTRVPFTSFQPIRIMAGYSGPPRRDISGAEWGPDRFFKGGRPSLHPIQHVARTNDPLLFQNSRIGDCTYDIPLPPGHYELHLYFVESEFGPEVGRGENDRTFFLHLNGERLERAIDIESDAMGPNIANERVYKDVKPGPDGQLHVAFESGTGVPLINAIEILPGLARKQLPVRIVTHPVPFTDQAGQVWQADNYYLNGQTCPRKSLVTGTPDPGLFTLERYGHFAYAIPVDVQGRYTVALHFAEFYFGPNAPGRAGVGSRVFNVTCNGLSLLENLDIFKEVGNGRALTKTAYHIKPTAQGKLNLMFEPVVNYALIYGIEVFDESK